MRTPATRCVVYRNTVIALNQHRHVSSVLDADAAAFADFFLRFKPVATQTGPCWGEVDPRQGGGPWDPICHARRVRAARAERRARAHVRPRGARKVRARALL